MIYNFFEFLKEEKGELQVYFFIPQMFNDTRAEQQAIELINLYFDNPIIYNTPEMRGSYYKFADNVNTAVVLPHPDGKISPRTMRRIAYAFDRGVSIYYMHPKMYKIIKIDNIEFFEEKTMTADDWQDRVNTDSADDYFKE